MKKPIQLDIIALLIFTNSFGQDESKEYRGYSEFEVETENCFDDFMHEHDVDWKILTAVFDFTPEP